KNATLTKENLLKLGAKAEDVEAAFESSKLYPFQPMIVIQDLSESDRLKVLEVENYDPAVKLVLGSKRVYPYGQLGAFITGYVGRASKEDLQRDANLRPSSIVGKMAAEKVFDSYLRGQPGVTEVLVDVSGRVVKEKLASTPVKGYDVYLTVDMDLQKVAWDAVASEVGGVIAANPKDGSIYALVSKPSFDPNVFVKGIDSATWKEYEKNSSLVNRMTMSQIPAGSTFKVVTGLAGLYYHAITPSFTINDPGYLQLGSARVWNYGHRSWGKVDFIKGLAVSNNVYFGTVGLRTGIDRIYEVAKTLGLTDYPWIEYDAVSKGTVPNQQWKKEVIGEPWYPGDTVNTSIGQGYVAVSPILMAQVYQQIINDGELYKSRFLKEVRDGKTVVFKAEPESRPQSTIYKSWFPVIREGLEAGVDWGLLKGLKSDLYTAAGKSGTAETERAKKYHKWLIAYANRSNPEIMVVSLRLYTTDTEPVKITKTVMEGYFRGKAAVR
ncbi:MAG TPA: penicillin-binding protein 2, partial [Coprothermobacter sp.]|nr:penicillin-binding protein 2 [Coprothermobacter sp.]